jgi:phosphohistidine phosphatase SixA
MFASTSSDHPGKIPHMIRRLHALALAALLAVPMAAAGCGGAPSPSPSPQGATTVIVVRHAEKATNNPQDPNPPLSPEGQQRARALAELLRTRQVAAVIATQFARTQLTGRPTADAAHVVIDTVPATRDVQAHAAAIAERIRTRYAGKTVLVVGHSNTVSKIVAALGGPALADLCDSTYGNLFTVVIPASGAPRFTQDHYGAADRPGGPACANGFVAPQPAPAPR